MTKFPTGTANNIITPTEITTAVIIIVNAPSIPFVIPTAVKILSIEKIKSINKVPKILHSTNDDGLPEVLASLNDSGASFKEIADFIEDNCDFYEVEENNSK